MRAGRSLHDDRLAPIADDSDAAAVAPTGKRGVVGCRIGAGIPEEHLPHELQQRALARLVRAVEDGYGPFKTAPLTLRKVAESVDAQPLYPHASSSMSRSTASSSACAMRAASSASTGAASRR